jgi:hypothetical protein
MPIGFSIWGPPLISAGIGYGMNKIGGAGSGAPGPTSPTFRRSEQTGDLAKEFAFDYALPQAKEAYDPVLKYYKDLLSGNRAEMMGAVAPEVGAIRSGYDQAKKNISAFTPRGGGQTSILSELPFRQNADIQRLLQTVRPAAAGNLGGLAGQIAGEGLNAGGLSLEAIAQQLNALLGKSSMEGPMKRDQGAGIYQILKQLMGSMGGGTGGGGGGGSLIGDFGSGGFIGD